MRFSIACKEKPGCFALRRIAASEPVHRVKADG